MAARREPCTGRHFLRTYFRLRGYATGRGAIIEPAGEGARYQRWHRDPSVVMVGRVLYAISSPLRNLCNPLHIMSSHFDTTLGCLVRALLASAPDRTSLASSTLSMARCLL